MALHQAGSLTAASQPSRRNLHRRDHEIHSLRSVPHPEPPKVLDEAGQVVPLHGAAAKIADNMQASLAVPTATSQRHIPVKVIDENRRLINQYLDLTGGGRIFAEAHSVKVIDENRRLINQYLDLTRRTISIRISLAGRSCKR